jgi:asparagine synthase (glutamine-hydrolysing)
MCGIAGFIDRRSGATAGDLTAAAQAMARAISHRGPDDEGVWVDASAGIGLGHRRLSIVDLSAEGHQPMTSHSGRFIAVFNGEIYNYVEMRQELDMLGVPRPWRGHSDTEVLLAACEAWGIEGAIQRSNGMFAIAIWDSLERQLLLARDRMGEKPLYYGWQGDVFLFGSELKALEAHRGFCGTLDERAISAYLRFGYVPTPLSIYGGVRKLEPGFSVRVPGRGGPGSETSGRYWQVPLPRESVSDSRDPHSIVDELHQLLRAAVKSRMHADVPLGAFLSGGIDSSTVAALMQASAGGGRVHTYSMGFEDKRHNEALHAAAIAKVLGTQHEELYLTSGDALEVVPHLPRMYDEPFADSSQIPTHMLSRLTRRHVTVALSGDAGDELFGGYVRYLQANKLLRLYRTVPAAARGAVAAGLRGLAGPLWDRLCLLGPKSLGVALSANRLAKLADVLCLGNHREMYARLVSQWTDPLAVAPGLPVWPTIVDDADLAEKSAGPLSWMMYLDQVTYLPDDILVKVDRASMSVGLETRVPFLDHRVVEFAARMPLTAKIRGSQGKWALRQILYRYVDRKLVERPKQGFAIPLAEWLRGPLRPWAEDLLSESALLSSGLLSPDPIRRAWLGHQSGRENQQDRLWVILMLQAWLKRPRPAKAYS